MQERNMTEARDDVTRRPNCRRRSQTFGTFGKERIAELEPRDTKLPRRCRQKNMRQKRFPGTEPTYFEAPLYTIVARKQVDVPVISLRRSGCVRRIRRIPVSAWLVFAETRTTVIYESVNHN
ncbi:hypothetical protein MPSEU_000873200 [Mayamaea pseudoterrestris]|nr:hypothetical protein MPSEU_000873200 [Mayamaea pseudoterrestris]